MSTDKPSPRRSWGIRQGFGFWFLSMAVGPFVLLAASLCGVAAATLLLIAPVMLLASDPRLHHSQIWDMDHGMGASLSALALIAGGLVGAFMALARWSQRAWSRINVEEDQLTFWSLLGQRRLPWGEVLRAFVTGTEEDGQLDAWTLHLWTARHQLALPIWRVVPERDPENPRRSRRDGFEAFLRQIEGHLAQAGRTMERGVPVTALTDVSWPVRYALLWPHRQWLVRQHRHLLEAAQNPVDHHEAIRSLRLAWWLRPSPMAAALVGAVALIWARWGTSHDAVPWVMGVLGLGLGVVLVLWNRALDLWRRWRWPGTLAPEMLIGHNRVPQELPSRLLPARGCLVELERGTVGRPDGSHIPIAELREVRYGPPRQELVQGALSSGLATPAWHMSVVLQGEPPQTREIFHNASVDVVRHGDLDAGYAMFNWILARELALRSQASLTLAQGRIAPGHLGKPLAEVLGDSPVRYDPAPLEAAMQAQAPSLRVSVSPERFEVWGPLWRQPESCATPPLWKALGALVALALVPTGLMAAGMVASYLGTAALHQWLTQRHFARPGFVLDRQGVWVRGQCVAWGELEQTSLMPVAPGPVLFAGARSLLVAGHLGASYAERAWLGCAAYRWIQDQVSQSVERAHIP